MLNYYQDILLFDEQLWVQFEILGELGVSLETIKTGIKRSSKYWQVIPNPADKRMRLIAYEAMRQKYKDLVIAKYGDPYEWVVTRLELQELESKAAQQQSHLDNLIEVDTEDYKFYLKRYSKTKALGYAKLCAYIRKCIAVRKLEAIAMGFSKKKDFMQAVLRHINSLEPALPAQTGSMQMLHRRMTAFKKAHKKGINAARETLLDGREGNDNSSKRETEGINYMIQLKARPEKLNDRIIQVMYNRQALQKGWKPIKSDRTVQNWMSKPEYRKIWYAARYGTKATYNYWDSKTKRSKASAPDLLWMMDGTPVDWYYQEKVHYFDELSQTWKYKTTFHNRIEMFCVMDAYSWKIIGYYLCEKENHVAVIEGLRDAVRKRMIRPKQIIYDQSSANKKVKGVLEELARYNTPSVPYEPASKTIEALFGHYKSTIERFSPNGNWSGMNITSKKQDSKMNTDYVNGNRWSFPTKEECIQHIESYIEAWNCMESSTRQKPNDLYAEKSGGIAIDQEDFINIFYVLGKQAYTYHNDGITLTINKKEYWYHTQDKDLYFELRGQKFQIKYDPDTMEYVYLYQNDKPYLDSKGQPVLLEHGEYLPQAIADYEDGSGKAVKDHLAFKSEIKAELVAHRNEMKEAFKESEFGVHMGAKHIHKEAFNEAEANLKVKQLQESPSNDWQQKFDAPYE